MSVFLIILYIISSSSSLILIKLGSNIGAPISIVDNAMKFNLNTYSIIGLLLYGLSFPIYIYLISKYDLGFIIPIATAFVYIIIFTASFLLFKELFTVIKAVAISLIVLGVILLQLNN